MPKYTSRTGPARRRGLTKSQVLYVFVTLVVIAAIVAAWIYHYRPSSKQTATIPSTTSTGTSVTPNNSGQNQSSSAPSSSPSTGSSPTAPTPTTTLVAPWGDFISNHHPGENGAPTTETSACNTSPGATCYIKFTNGALTRTLTSKIADGRGSVIWNWDVKDAGFSTGTWKVTAIATLSGQTKTTADSLPLVIQ